MKTYKQTVRFERHFEIEAPDAARANEKLEDLVRQAEWNSDVQSEGFYEFEDEPVECPECHGLGVCNQDEETEHQCSRCGGDGCVPFVAE